MAMTSKKGLFFSMITILIVGLMVLTFSTSTEVGLTARLPTIERRVLVLNEFVGDVRDNYAERMLRIATIKTLKYFKEQAKDGKIANFDKAFEVAILNGTTLDNTVIVPLGSVFLRGKLKQLTEKAETELRINSQVDPHRVWIRQNNETGPWNVEVTMLMDLTVDGDIALWNMTTVARSIVPIIGFDDPLYAIKAQVDHPINNSDFRVWNISTVTEMVEAESYRNEPLAPSYLQRFTLNYTPSECCGIESIVTLPIKIDASYVDYCLWSSTCLTETYGGFVWEVPELNDLEGGKNILLDSLHVGVFNLTEYTDKFCRYDFKMEKWQNDEGCNTYVPPESG